LPQQDILVGHFGAFVQRVFTVNKTGKLQASKKDKKKSKGM
jgi:hypothetical protein